MIRNVLVQHVKMGCAFLFVRKNPSVLKVTMIPVYLCVVRKKMLSEIIVVLV